ncbi:hypothetical protein [Clostridium sp. YIM B02555]|uniref:hypothetical protein n=1 Tax=Clostridium sp. YIM B02555 TaxID=2911968 RepID=UPI001EED36E1|nr:hypothetical protein [Clostridium sp. YIM B02555]
MIKKIESLKQNEFFDKWIIKTSSGNIFYIMFITLFLSMLLIDSTIVKGVLLSLYSVIFILRICFRRKKLNNLYYYKINDENQKEDRSMRSYQLGDGVAIVMFIFLVVLFYSDKNTSSIIFIFAFVIMIYFTFASISISRIRFNTFLKVITLLLSTIQGVIMVLSGIYFITGSVAIIMKLIRTGKIDYNIIVETFFEIIDYRKIMKFTYFIKEYNNSVAITIIILTLISILLYIIFIRSVPAYQLDKLSFALKIVNAISVLFGIAIYFYGNGIYPYIQEYINGFKSDPQLILKYLGDNPPNELINYVENYNKAEIINLGYILFLPYTIAILIANLVVEFIKSKYTKKANLALDKIFEICENDSSEDIEIYEKRFYYYGGDKHKMKLIRKMFKL